jgi:AcrR family transcriptional regulator
MPRYREEQAWHTLHRSRGRRRDDDAKKRILQASLELLEEFGFANTTVEAIAERAGTGKATVYRWWPDKSAVMIEGLREALPQELPLPNTGNFHQDIRFQLRNVLRLLHGHRGRVFKAFILAAQHDPEIAAIFQTIWCEPRRRDAKIALERYQNTALRENLDLDVVLDVIYGPMYCRLLLGPRPMSVEYTDALADIVLRGIANS